AEAVMCVQGQIICPPPTEKCQDNKVWTCDTTLNDFVKTEKTCGLICSGDETKACDDGSTITTRKCVNNAWVDTGETCGGAPKPNALLLIVTLILSVAAFIYVYGNTMFLSVIKIGKTKVGTYARLALSLIAAGIVFVVVPVVMKAIVAALKGLFTISLF
ncbi:MAG TPA: hypothetical protein VJ044_14585, partial [Candidatus Hodarchaeales archaeon]|nr:hypothetical protein [Candidatus Hodarchaeales archaeon]